MLICGKTVNIDIKWIGHIFVLRPQEMVATAQKLIEISIYSYIDCNLYLLIAKNAVTCSMVTAGDHIARRKSCLCDAERRINDDGDDDCLNGQLEYLTGSFFAQRCTSCECMNDGGWGHNSDIIISSLLNILTVIDSMPLRFVQNLYEKFPY